MSIFTIVLSVRPYVYFYYCVICPSFCLFLLLCYLSVRTIVKIDKRTDRQHNSKNRKKDGQTAQ
jgi:hypothetical protein